MVLPVEYKIRIIHDGQVVEPSDYSKIVIVNQIVDRIVNETGMTASFSLFIQEKDGVA